MVAPAPKASIDRPGRSMCCKFGWRCGCISATGGDLARVLPPGLVKFRRIDRKGVF
jgi:hypothetical protein